MAVDRPRWYAAQPSDSDDEVITTAWTWRPRLQVNDDWSVGLDLWFTSKMACEEFIRDVLNKVKRAEEE